MCPIPPFHVPWKHQKTKSPPVFPGECKTGRSTTKGPRDKIKTIEDLLQVKKTTTTTKKKANKLIKIK